MALLVTATALGIAALLFWSGTEKLRAPAGIAGTIQALGVPRRIAFAAGLAIALLEIAIAAAVLFRPDERLTQFGVVALAMTFAVAGVLALRHEEPIRCHCLGRGGKLGWTQLIALVPWLAAAMILRLAERPSIDTAAALFAATGIAIAAARGTALRGAQRQARGDRQSAKEMYAWLQSH